MKEKIVSIAIIVFVAALIIIELKTFKGEINLNNANDFEDIVTNYDDKIETQVTEGAEYLAQILGVDNKYATSKGLEIRDRTTFYCLNSWSIQTESPGFTLPTGITLETLSQGNDGIEFDEAGNIISNNYYYVIMNVSVRNAGETSIAFRAQCIHLMGIRDDKYWYSVTSDPEYLGEEVLRVYDKNYMTFTIDSNDETSFNLVYLVSRTLVDDKELFIHINPSGSGSINTDMSVYSSQRFILLD